MGSLFAELPAAALLCGGLTGTITQPAEAGPVQSASSDGRSRHLYYSITVPVQESHRCGKELPLQNVLYIILI